MSSVEYWATTTVSIIAAIFITVGAYTCLEFLFGNTTGIVAASVVGFISAVLVIMHILNGGGKPENLPEDESLWNDSYDKGDYDIN